MIISHMRLQKAVDEFIYNNVKGNIVINKIDEDGIYWIKDGGSYS